MATVRYIVDDVDASIDFYCRHLGFREVMHPAPPFAMLARDDLRFAIVAPIPTGHPGGGSRPMSDGTTQQPGGWNRFMLEVSDVEAMVADLRGKGVSFRSDVVTGVGGKQALVEDPSGNLVELFEPILPEAHESATLKGDTTG
ncbi:MAG: VOC family protein [Marmoricola sp.]